VRDTPHYFYAKSLLDGNTSGEGDYLNYLVSQYGEMSAYALSEKISQFRRLADSLSSDNAKFVVLGRIAKDHILILDGFHRLALYEAAGLETIRVRLTT